ncbi:MAG: hypothetical protein KDB10_01790 [Acidimicrobiales bacterium]|nr:hypothetical protein [Acidimicrobiales bacterium]MCB9372350.1 hypothetical protein [Microthrixaceae bacterium]
MKKLLPGIVVGVGLFLLVTQPSASADWVESALSVATDIWDGVIEFLKQLLD